MNWSVGFLFDDAGRVALIEKKRPAWQAGKLNGIGGKVEPGETPAEAMRREFREETGVDVADWHHFMTLRWEAGDVFFYRSFASHLLAGVQTTTDEMVQVTWADAIGVLPTIPNLAWIVPLARHTHDRYEPILVEEAGSAK